MKTILKLITAFTFLNLISLSQTTNHPTISSVKVAYKSSTQTSTISVGQIAAIPHATITLKQNINAAAIHFKIVEMGTNSVVYETEYNFSTSPVLHTNGNKLFENVNGNIFISSEQALPLKPYTFEVYTKDSQANSTAIFSVIQ